MTRIAIAIVAISVLALAFGAPKGTTVRERQVSVNGTQETILTDAQGMSLYYYDEDAPDTATCTGNCAKLWPALTLKQGAASGPPDLPKGLATFQGPNGRQVEYHGHPLYTYAKDQAPGDTHGVGVFPTWHLATPSMPAGSAGSSATSSWNSGSGGSVSGGSSSSGGSGSGGGGSGY